MKFVHVLKICCVFFVLTFLGGAILIYPERYINCCLNGFLMWGECVLPSIFPFAVITMIFIKSGYAKKFALPLRKVTSFFNLPPISSVCFLMSVFSGYPMGARSILEFYDLGCINENDAKKLSVLCSTSSPLFIIGSVGVKMLGDKVLGIVLLFAHVFSVLIVGIIVSLFFRGAKSNNLVYAKKDNNVLYNSFYGAIISVLVAGGVIAFFFVLTQVCIDFNLLLPIEKFFCLFLDRQTAISLTYGIIEVTTGCKSLAMIDSRLKLPLMGFILTLGGICILMQQVAYLAKAKVNVAFFVGVKILQGVVCFLMLLSIRLII